MCFAPTSPFFFVWKLTPLAMGGLSDWVSRTVCLSIERSAPRARIVHDARVREPCSAAQLSLPSGASRHGSLLVRSLPSNPSLRYVRRARITNDDAFDMPLSAISGRIKTFFLVSCIVLTQNGCVSTCISWKTNQSSFMAIVFIDENITITVAWEKNYATCNKHVSLIHP
jgi:hypothetical protein